LDSAAPGYWHFPWHGLIELSFQSADEMHLSASVGDWRHYNFTAADGKWTAAAHLEAEMQTEWTRDHSAAERFFEAAGNVAKSASLQGRLSELFPDAAIQVTVFNPDNVASRNYAA